MAVVTMLLRGELRHRWRSWLAGALLIALVSGLVLAGVATARRTATAFPRYEATHGFDTFFYSIDAAPRVNALPAVASSVAIRSAAIGTVSCACSHPINATDFAVDEVVPPARQTRISKLVAGRFPDQSRPDEVLASFTLQQTYGVHIGTVFRFRLFSTAQRQAVLANKNVKPAGPKVTLRVVGIEASEYEFPSTSTPSYTLYTTQAYGRLYDAKTVLFHQYFLSLRHGAAVLPRFESRARSLGALSFTDLDAFGSAVRSSIEPQAVGWWILSGLVALVGIAVVLQALLRQAFVESEIFPTLGALGAPRRTLVWLVMARTAVMGLVGVLLAVALSAVLSFFTPFGEARIADPTPGFSVDPWILVPGACVAFAVVMLLGIWPAVRTTRAAQQDATVSRPSRVASLLSATGAPVSVLIGVRHAFERGRGRGAVPVGSALVGAVLAVAALSATAVFGTSLSNLTSSPRLYGQAFDAWFSLNATGSRAQNMDMAAAVQRPGVSAVTMGIAGDVEINGKVVHALAGQSLRGRMLITVTSGRLPSATDEVLLGRSTMRVAGAKVGSVVRVSTPSSGGGIRNGTFRVVGTAVFPPDFNGQGLGTGAVFTLRSLAGDPCPGPNAEACQIQTVAQDGGVLLVKADPNRRGLAALDALTRSYAGDVSFPVPPTNLVNFGEAVNFPLIFGLVVALFGGATLLHFLVVSVARRRREVGVLKSLGFVRRQVALAVSWQATTIALIGVAIGVPLGIALGRVVWSAFATNLGVFPQLAVNATLIALIACGAFVVANVLAIGPALASARWTSASLLKAE